MAALLPAGGGKCESIMAVFRVVLLMAFVQKSSSEWIDMSYALGDKISTLIYPGITAFSSKNLHRGATGKGFWYESNEFCSGEHRGTHFDAPNHFFEKGWSVDEVPIDRLFMKPVVRVDISARAQQSSNVFLTREDLEDWEKSHGRIPDGSVVILYSNWGQHHQNPYAYYGSSTPMDATTVSYPGFHPEAAKWLIESRRIHGVGTDCVSIESPKTVGHTVHRLFAAENLFNLEQLAHVDLLPPNGSYIIVGPMKIRGGSGGPARVYALKPPFDAAEAALFRAATKDAVIDLAHDLSENTVRWPNGRMFQLTVEPPPPHVSYWLLKYSFCSPEHIGTHLDAPIHFSKDGLSSADIEIQHFIADGIVMDVESQARGSPDFVLTDTHVTEWEAKFGRIPEGSIVFLKTGWSSKLPKMEDYYGTPDYNDTTKLHFPGYSAEAAKLLIEERSVAGLGIDTASVDPGNSEDFLTHQVAGQNDVYNLENVANLQKFSSGFYKVVILPAKIVRGSGGPARIFMLTSDSDAVNIGASRASKQFLADDDKNGADHDDHDHDHADDDDHSHRNTAAGRRDFSCMAIITWLMIALILPRDRRVAMI